VTQAPDFEEIFKLGGVVVLSNMTLDYLYDMNALARIIN
jgi:hypothetical protein